MHSTYFFSAFRRAKFRLSQRNKKQLVDREYTFVLNGVFAKTSHWRCSQYRRYRCKAKAISMRINGVENFKYTESGHTHRKSSTSNK